MVADPRTQSLEQHKKWLGYLQPVGLVVSAPALVDADCHVNLDVSEEHRQFVALVKEQLVIGRKESEPIVPSIKELLVGVFGWKETDLVPSIDPRAENLVASIQVYGEVLRPKFGVPDDSRSSPPKWMMLVDELPPGTELDAVLKDGEQLWKATPQARFERLIRETEVAIGLIANGTHLRLVYAPRGESAGHLSFPIAEMVKPTGRLVFAALLMLLKEFRVFGAADGRRLADVLVASRKYQNTVSTELAKQLLAALYELLRGIQAADARTNGEILREVLAKNPDEVYAGQLTVLLRLVFLLYAEDRGLMSNTEVYVKHYSVTGLFEKLRADEGRHPDTIDQRYGAWARLLALFRMVHDGARSGAFRLPPRRGYLFDPDRYPFLEGRPPGHQRGPRERITPPLVSDGVVLRVLRNLLILDGERLSYRALDVEQIGSVYEAMMGFRVETATGRSIAVRPKKPHGAPVTINLEVLLAASPSERAKKFKEWTELSPTATESTALKAAMDIDGIVQAITRKIEDDLTPNIVPAGNMVLQPSDERRRSGSHYTPRSLTGPIVAKALEPVLMQLGDSPTPEQLLGLKVCDPAMGSGAFLVEACRQLGERLVEAWAAHKATPIIPPDEDEILHAQRLVAQRCLYGVDKNPMAVDLAKLSLWLSTLAKDHPFTFLDHALKEGDSLVGLTREEIEGYHWPGVRPKFSWRNQLRPRLEQALRIRREILTAGDEMPYGNKEAQLANCRDALETARQVGDMVIACFFAGSKDKTRKALLERTVSEYSDALTKTDMLTMRRSLAESAAVLVKSPALRPFHWEIEYPEVFDVGSYGFDVIVGNPPFLRGKGISGAFGSNYREWIATVVSNFSGNADIVAAFYRRSYELLRQDGAFGLIATNTISQGDTRQSGLKTICTTGGSIYSAVRRFQWPGLASVITSVVHVLKGRSPPQPTLDGRPASSISAYLVESNNSDDPFPIPSNVDKCFQGTIVLGMGFTFDDEDKNGVATALSEMRRILNEGRYQECIVPYIGSEEVNNHPSHQHSRYVIDFGDRTEAEARAFPHLFQIVEHKVKPERMKLAGGYKTYWWRFGRHSREGRLATQTLKRVMVTTCSATPHLSITFLPNGMVYANSLDVFAFDSYAAFSALQSRPHEVWARFFTSSFKDDLRYAPTDCFETFPFPLDFETNAALEAVGKQYYEFRAGLMVRNNEGLTKTYNRFHDPDERAPDILKLRELHATMDRAVLDAYGGGLAKLAEPPCEFLLDYEDEEDDDEQAGRRQRKKPWRYRWPDAFRDEVLALLLELNKQRAAEEGTSKKPVGKRKKAAAKSEQPDEQDRMFADEAE